MTEKADWKLLDVGTRLPDIPEEAWRTDSKYGNIPPYIRTETYYHLPSGETIRVHRHRRRGPSALCTEIDKLGVFYYRGDSSEGGSGTHWLSVFSWNKPRKRRYQINHMRNSVSHPSTWSERAKHPCTGFSDVKNGSDDIVAVRFLHSPDEKNGGPISFREHEKERAWNYIGYESRTTKEWHYRDGFPPDAEPVWDCGKWHIYSEGKPFSRIFKIEIPVPALKQFVQELSCRVANAYSEQ